ncbi:VOC family protein [Caballeronia sp. LZ001]|uniref:VOC family protein n=1 Tax=Caballeronia sp. LZ001 TaxID=3038553 RepID=UPI0028601D10|nr:VOC family protein [Caballeronia sp. LZ001]MDR5804753.1 VOC family protein [Caballeronia sp. LZ001]
MLSYVMLGADDISASERFFTALLSPLGYEITRFGSDKVVYSLPNMRDPHNGPGAVYVTKPYDGKQASVGNGSMTAFRVNSAQMVEELHSAGVEAGGTDEGAPGFRAEYSDDFYVAYLRDPLGNKVALFFTLNR